MENYGVDSPTCGASGSPCRSISQAIANAPIVSNPLFRPRILIGPGRYGDLGDSFQIPGSEHPGLGRGCGCMILVDRPVVIESVEGAAATVLEPGIDFVFLRLVLIASSDVVFGSSHHGFTMVDFDDFPNTAAGLTVQGGTDGVSVGGNLAVGLAGPGFVVLAGSGHRLEGNLAVAGQEGFRVEGAGATVVGNLAVANSPGTGFYLAATAMVVDSNVASDNARSGFVIWGEGAHLTSNIASGNRIDGFEIRADGTVMSRNHALGNVRAGISVDIAVPDSGTWVGTSIQRGNIAGNNPTAMAPGLLNCGLANFTTGGAPPVNATRNWWGLKTGPGPAEPSDDICGPGPTVSGPYLQAPAAVNALSFF